MTDMVRGVLAELHSSLADLVSGTERDPYADDTKIGEFFASVLPRINRARPVSTQAMGTITGALLQATGEGH